MKSLRRRYNKIVSKHNQWNSYTCFAEAIKWQKFSHRTIKHWFNRLVDKADYDPREKGELLKFLNNLTLLPTPTGGSP